MLSMVVAFLLFMHLRTYRPYKIIPQITGNGYNNKRLLAMASSYIWKNIRVKTASCLANSAGIFYNGQEKEGRLLFNIGFAELLLVLVIAYVIVGPKDLPRVARWLGRMVRRARQLIREIKSEVGWDEMMAETEDVRRDIDATLKETDITTDLKDAGKTLRKTVKEAENDAMKKTDRQTEGKP